MTIAIKKYAPKEQPLKILLAGGPARGKTTAASTLPNPIFICAENGLLSIADKEPLMIETKTIEDVREALTYLKRYFATPIEQRTLKIETVVMDTLSSLAETIRNNLTQNGTKSMIMKDWGTLGDQLMGVFRQFINLPCNVVFLCHTKDVEDEKEKIVVQDLALSGRAKEEVLRDFDIVAYIDIDQNGERYITVKESAKTKAKCRSKALKAVENLPLDLSEWIKIINNNTDFGEDKVVAEISKEAPSENATTIWEGIKNDLLQDASSEKKLALSDRIDSSTKLTKEEKEWLLEKLNGWS